MKHLYCKKCNSVLPKWETICDKCGHINEEFNPKVINARKRRNLIVALSVLTCLVIAVIICNAAMLFPWQYRARHNKNAILEYAQHNYPGAKIIEEHYPTMMFNPTGDPYDVIWFEFDEIEFYISARHGEVNYDDDGYGFALLTKEIRVRYLDKFFDEKQQTYKPDINFYNYGYNWPGKDASLDTFQGSIRLDFVIDYEESKEFPEDYGWFYDFYCYWKEVCPTEGFTLRYYYRTSSSQGYQLYCYSNSDINDKDDFFSRMEFKN